MFSKPGKAAQNLTDAALQQELAALEKRHRRTQRIGGGLLLLGCLAATVAGGILGGIFLAGTPATVVFYGVPMGALIAMNTFLYAGEKIRDGYLRQYKSKSRPLVEETTRRVAEQPQMKKPLDSSAREAFIQSLSDGTKDTVEVLKPLRLKKAKATFSSPAMS